MNVFLTVFGFSMMIVLFTSSIIFANINVFIAFLLSLVGLFGPIFALLNKRSSKLSKRLYKNE